MQKNKKNSKPIETPASDSTAIRLPKPWILLAGILLLTTLAYIPALYAPPYLDDYSAIIENPNITDASNLSHILSQFFVNRGLVQLSFLWEWNLLPNAPASIPKIFMIMHISNIFFHLLTTILIYFCVRAVADFLDPKNQTGIHKKYTGLLAAALFALHPINTQPITYTIARADIYATFFFILGIFLSIKIIALTTQSLLAKFGKILLFSLNFLFCFALGFSCKEIIVTLPFILVLLFVYSWRQQKLTTILWRLSLAAIPVILAMMAYFIYRKTAMHSDSFLAIPDVQARSPLTNLRTQCSILVFYYLPRLFVPIYLYFRPPYPLSQSIADPRFLASAFVIAGLLLMAIRNFRKWPLVSFGIFWFFITLAPTSSIIPIWDLVTERRIYLPFFGFALLAECLIYLYPQTKNYNRKILIATLSLVFIFFPILTFSRNLEYTNPLTFWQKEYQRLPTNLENLHNYLFQLQKEKKTEELRSIMKNLDWNQVQTENEYIDANSLDAVLRIFLGNKINNTYITKLAKQNVQLQPNNPDYLVTYQYGLMSENRYKDAIAVIDQALKLNSKHLDSLLNKASIYKFFYQKYRDEKNPANAQACLDVTQNTLNQILSIQPDYIPALKVLLSLKESLGQDTAQLRERIQRAEKSQPFQTDILLEATY